MQERFLDDDVAHSFVIEFENQAAADLYAKHPVDDTWTEALAKIREASLSPRITND